jgi:hypothetical protein
MIKGLTDGTSTLRRDGKIRSGLKGEGNKLINTPNFLLHDAPQLIPALGEKPTEIFFTVYSDDLGVVARNDLRWYSKSELNCLGDGEMAAFCANGDPDGVMQKPHPKIPRSRQRICRYRQCPEYISGMCSEHLFLDMLIPQYSMASVFTVDNSSIGGLLNVISAFQKAQIKHAGKISGQIFRLFKKDAEIGYQNPKTGQKSKREVPVIHMEYVPFSEYERKFRDKITDDDWEALLSLRHRASLVGVQAPVMGDIQEQLAGPAPQNQLPAPELSDDDYVRERANNPVVMPLFDELAKLLGRPNSEEARMNTARSCSSVQVLSDRLKGYIAATRKKQAAIAQAQAPQVAHAPESSQATQSQAPVEEDVPMVSAPVAAPTSTTTSLPVPPTARPVTAATSADVRLF